MAETAGPVAPPLSRPVAGVLWQVTSGLMFVGMTAALKHSGDGIPAAQSAFLRFVLGVPLLIPFIPALLRVRVTPRLGGLIGGRAVMHTLAVLLWFYALTRIPLAEVTAMNYLNPVYVMLGAVLILGEPFRARRMIAVVVAVLGALVILRPGFRVVESGHLAMLFTSAFMAASYLFAKRLSGEMPAGAVVALLSLTVPLCLAPFVWMVWVPVGPDVMLGMFAAAAFGTAAHYCMTRAFAAAPMGVTQPVSFLQLVWSVLLGYFAFSEAVDPLVIIGGVLILAAVGWSAWADARERRLPEALH